MTYLLVVGLGLITTVFAASEEFVKANNLFAVSLYKQILSSKDDNFLMSPYSAESVLAFAQSGCRGATAQEIRKSLHLPDDNDQVELAVKESLPLLTGNIYYTLRIANKMYVKEDFPIKDGFKNTATEVYQADIENINFKKNVEAANTMNEWVEKQTNDKIRNLIDPKQLDEHTRTILINALYFKGNWSSRFPKFITEKKEFYKTAKEIIKIDTMHQFRKWFNYYENPEINAQILELPFEGGDISMTIVLPNNKEGLSSLEKQIDKVFTPQQLKREFLNVALPKFKIESKFTLSDALKSLGMKKAFNESEADLSGIAGDKGDLVINDVIQQTYIDVEEDGVEAAAATYVAIAVPISAHIPEIQPEPKEFIADHPFIFYIKAKNFIIFAGRVLNPGK